MLHIYQWRTHIAKRVWVCCSAQRYKFSSFVKKKLTFKEFQSKWKSAKLDKDVVIFSNKNHNSMKFLGVGGLGLGLYVYYEAIRFFFYNPKLKKKTIPPNSGYLSNFSHFIENNFFSLVSAALLFTGTFFIYGAYKFPMSQVRMLKLLPGGTKVEIWTDSPFSILRNGMRRVENVADLSFEVGGGRFQQSGENSRHVLLKGSPVLSSLPIKLRHQYRFEKDNGIFHQSEIFYYVIARQKL